jgi:hypothetical protein
VALQTALAGISGRSEASVTLHVTHFGATMKNCDIGQISDTVMLQSFGISDSLNDLLSEIN